MRRIRLSERTKSYINLKIDKNKTDLANFARDQFKQLASKHIRVPIKLYQL